MILDNGINTDIFCPECRAAGNEKYFKNPALRGVHRRIVHKVYGTSPASIKEREKRAAAATGSGGGTGTGSKLTQQLTASVNAKKASKQHEQSESAPASVNSKSETSTSAVSPDTLIYSLGRTEEFIKGLAEQAGVPSRQLIHWVAESLFRSTRR